jgi:7-carboxy-7-deazaguanine synthase
MPNYPIYETFASYQGEGTHTGVAAFFIRTFGCPIQCPWCDAAGTWHPDHIPERIERLDAQQLTQLARESGRELVIVTGGEPCVHDLGDLTYHLRLAGLKTHLETSGAYPIRGEWDSIAISPKWNVKPMAQNLERASEWKIIVEDEHSIREWWTVLERHHRGQPVWLQIEWSQVRNARAWDSIYTWIAQHCRYFRIGYQMHKVWGCGDRLVDARDPRSVPPVPLGGDPSRGY